MFSIWSFVLTLYLIEFAEIVLGQQLTPEQQVECERQTTYDIASSITQPLTITLYYHAGVQPDWTYLTSLCTAKREFPDLIINPIVGDSVKEDENGLTCYTVDLERTYDCTSNIIAACASQLVDFPLWIDCTVCGGGDPTDCISCQDESKVEEFNQCVEQTHPTICPSEILLNNANASDQIYDPSGCKPILLFNGLQDACARYMFYEDPVKVVGALLQGSQSNQNNQGNQDNSNQ